MTTSSAHPREAARELAHAADGGWAHGRGGAFGGTSMSRRRAGGFAAAALD